MIATLGNTLKCVFCDRLIELYQLKAESREARGLVIALSVHNMNLLFGIQREQYCVAK